MSLSLPFERSYWLVQGRILAGCYPGEPNPHRMRPKLEALVGAGVTRVINLMFAHERDHAGNRFVDYSGPLRELGQSVGRSIECERLPIVDMDTPTPARMREILSAIDEETARGGVIYLHCWGGRGRTGTVAGCYLVEHEGFEAEEALLRVSELTAHASRYFWPTPQTPEQCSFVRHWMKMAESLAGGPGLKDRFRGALIGLATGDALGTTLEFKAPGSFSPIGDMIGGGPFGLEPGQWTDDTSMALCLGSSLVEQGGFDAADQMRRYVKWWREGYLSSTSRCFDIGVTVSGALARFEADGNAWAGSTDPRSAGNGSIMRLAPVPLFYLHDVPMALQKAGQSSRTTHGTAAALDACRYMAGLIVGAIAGVGKDELLSPLYSPLKDAWKNAPLDPAIAAVARGSFKRKPATEIRGTGYVVASLEAALWAFYHGASFEEGCLKAANLGDDADTTAAVYGQIAGAYYGESGIPAQWRERLAKWELLDGLAEALFSAAQAPACGRGAGSGKRRE